MSTTTTPIEFGVEGMTCQHCVMTITRELTALDGVAGASVDLDGKSATVVPDGTVDAESIVGAARTALAEFGYAVV